MVVIDKFKPTPEQIRVIAEQQSKSVCKITTSKCKATGFLCRIPNAINPVLITCNHILNEAQIKPGEEINIYFDEKKYHKHFKIDETRTTYSVGKLDGEDIDTTIIELRPDKDNLNEQEFMEIDNELMNDNVKDIYEEEDIYSLQYNAEKCSCSTGTIKEIVKEDKSYTL